MQSTKIRMLTETVQSLLNRGAAVNLQKLLAKTHVADVALVFRALSSGEREAIFSVVHGADERAELLQAFDDRIQLQLAQALPEEELARILESMPSDEAADILGLFEEDISARLLSQMHQQDSIEVEELLGYAPDTAGGIMATDFMALTEDTAASDAIDVLRTSRDVDMVFYLYVVNDYGHLVGVVSLRNLVTVPPSTKLRAIMETNVIRVRPDTDQEEVANLVARYNFLAIPVVDDANTLLGIVTVDDVIDVIQEEAQEDMLKMAGAGADLEANRPVRGRFRARLPWFALVFLGSMGCLLILSSYSELFYKRVSLVLFIPLLLALSNSVAVQSSTFVVQILSRGLLPPSGGRGLLMRETIVGLGLGLFSALAAGAIASLMDDVYTGVVVSVSVVVSVVLAAVVGALAPLVMSRLMRDPAVATTPIARVAVDMLSVTVYLVIASLFAQVVGL